MSTATKQPSESASEATPLSRSAPAAAAPKMPRAIPAKRARLPAQKAASKSAPARKASLKKIAVKKVTAKAITPPKNAALAPLSKAAGAAKPEKKAAPHKAKKDKLIRDSFTIPKAEYAVIDELKQRSIRLARPAKRSELLRAGIKLLASLPDAALLAALAQVPTIKTGRPAL